MESGSQLLALWPEWYQWPGLTGDFGLDLPKGFSKSLETERARERWAVGSTLSNAAPTDYTGIHRVCALGGSSAHPSTSPVAEWPESGPSSTEIQGA